MSKFSGEKAREFAKQAFGKAEHPLVGKTDGLLEALTAGEALYVQWRDEIEALKKLRNADADRFQRFLGFLESARRALGSLNDLDEITRAELASIASARGVSLEQIEKSFEEAIACAHEGIVAPFPRSPTQRGRKLGIGKIGLCVVPLEEFAKVLRNFWEKEVEGLKFSFHEERNARARVPASAAARLLFEASRELDRRIAVSHIEYVMKAIKRQFKFRTDIFGDPKIDAYCSAKMTGK